MEDNEGRPKWTAFVVSLVKRLFRSLHGNLAELFHQLRQLESRLAGARAGSLVALLHLRSGVGCEHFELGVDLFY